MQRCDLALGGFRWSRSVGSCVPKPTDTPRTPRVSPRPCRWMRRAMTLCFELKCFSLYYFSVRERVLIDPWICIRRIASWSQSQLQNSLIIILMTWRPAGVESRGGNGDSRVTLVKNPPAMQEMQETGSISGSGRSLGVGNGNCSSILVCKIPLAEEPGGLQSMGSQRAEHDWASHATPGVESGFSLPSSCSSSHSLHLITHVGFMSLAWLCHILKAFAAHKPILGITGIPLGLGLLWNWHLLDLETDAWLWQMLSSSAREMLPWCSLMVHLPPPSSDTKGKAFWNWDKRWRQVSGALFTQWRFSHNGTGF